MDVSGPRTSKVAYEWSEQLQIGYIDHLLTMFFLETLGLGILMDATWHAHWASLGLAGTSSTYGGPTSHPTGLKALTANVQIILIIHLKIPLAKTLPKPWRSCGCYMTSTSNTCTCTFQTGPIHGGLVLQPTGLITTNLVPDTTRYNQKFCVHASTRQSQVQSTVGLP